MLDSSPSDASPRVGIAPDSWGVWNPQDPVQPPADQYLREAQQAGYHLTELGPFGYLGTDPTRLADDLSAHDLVLTGGTVFTGLHRDTVNETWDAVAQVAKLVKTLGAEHVIVIPELWQRGTDGRVTGSRTFTIDQWNRFLSAHDELGRRLLNEFGLHQQFHSHAESPVGSWSEVTRLLEGTDAQYTNLCLDTGHFAYYLGDTLALVKAHPERIGYLHLKQVDPALLPDVLKNDIDFATAVKQGIMIEPPYGTPAYAPVLAEAAKSTPGIFAVVEQDLYPVANFDVPLPIARRTLEHITTCGTPVRVR